MTQQARNKALRLPTPPFQRAVLTIVDGCVPLIGVVYFKSPDDQNRFPNFKEVRNMKWEKPSYNDLRFGFEVTMYIYNR